MKKLLVVLLCLGLVGCALTASITRDKLTRLTLNMTTDQVKQIMGEPFSTETYLANDGKTNLIWNYRTQYSTDDYGIRHQELTPLIFKDNVLLGWGNNFYDQLIQPNKVKQDIQLKVKQE